MIDPQSAYKYIYYLLKCDDESMRWPLTIDSMQLFKELAEKATPKKIIYSYKDRYYRCPSCNRKLSRRVQYHFCPKKECGQALDWEDPLIKEELET